LPSSAPPVDGAAPCERRDDAPPAKIQARKYFLTDTTVLEAMQSQRFVWRHSRKVLVENSLKYGWQEDAKAPRQAAQRRLKY
jgi:hypothetical protein